MNKKYKDKYKYKKPKSWTGLVNFIENNLLIQNYDKRIEDELFINWFKKELFISEDDFIDNIYPSTITIKLNKDWNLGSFKIIKLSDKNLFSIFNGCKEFEVIEIIFKAYYRMTINNKPIEAHIQNILNEKLIKNIIE